MTSRSMSEQFVLPDDVNPEFPFWCVEEEDGSITLHWDENHPVTSVFNSWTEEQFVKMLTSSAEEVIRRLEGSTDSCQNQ